MKIKSNIYLIVAIALLGVLGSCKGKQSATTGWNYDDPKNGGFEYGNFVEQQTGPGLVLVEGGTFTMGRVQDDVLYEWNSVPRRVTVSSFYMDQTEVRNVDYREYLYWIERVFSAEIDPQRNIIKNALPFSLTFTTSFPGGLSSNRIRSVCSHWISRSLPNIIKLISEICLE